MFGYRHALLAQGAEAMLRGDPEATSWRGSLSLGAASRHSVLCGPKM
jgi:hypothetical protein